MGQVYEVHQLIGQVVQDIISAVGVAVVGATVIFIASNVALVIGVSVLSAAVFIIAVIITAFIDDTVILAAANCFVCRCCLVVDSQCRRGTGRVYEVLQIIGQVIQS